MAHEMIKRLHPGVLTLDVQMPKWDGVDFIGKPQMSRVPSFGEDVLELLEQMRTAYGAHLQCVVTGSAIVHQCQAGIECRYAQ